MEKMETLQRAFYAYVGAFKVHDWRTAAKQWPEVLRLQSELAEMQQDRGTTNS